MSDCDVETIDGMQSAVLLLLSLIMMPIVLLADGLIMYCLWMWFVLPFGAPPISYWHACGLGMLLFMTICRSIPKAEKTFSGHVVSVIGAPIRAMVLLGCIFVLHLWM